MLTYPLLNPNSGIGITLSYVYVLVFFIHTIYPNLNTLPPIQQFLCCTPEFEILERVLAELFGAYWYSH